MAGADTRAFGTGNYALTFAFEGGTPAVPLPDTQVVNGFPLQAGGGMSLSTENGFLHGVGCNCPACRAARAAMVQQLELRQVLMVASQKEHEKGLAGTSILGRPRTVWCTIRTAKQSRKCLFLYRLPNRAGSRIRPFRLISGPLRRREI